MELWRAVNIDARSGALGPFVAGAPEARLAVVFRCVLGC